ncbi:MAG: tyrosine--tRNA ligase [Devosia nanyangense]|uniref:Tyrosine--tRNA ligase n=1 Tax=Devosia nanyangense TaxID=1228055 RepID=A0A933KXJ7_9HYPH|nr:tyrosine--tRNA ligase [Devosia nanyangense]
MMAFKSDFLRILEERGFIHQISDPEGLDEKLLAGPITAYIGFDATAQSLHAGSLIQIMLLYWLQQTGNRPITLMGGGTTMIGDPSFKDEARPLLTVEAIDANIEKLKRVFAKILRYGDGPADALMANNADWLLKLNYVEFLRDVGRHFSVNRMLSFDSVKLRMEREQSLSFLEFNYMILQGYDFVELNRRYDVTLQMSGSDQWGNIVNGIDLSHRMGGPQLYALTTPLLTTSSGAKMGKTASGAVWLNEELLSPYDFWQYWRNVEDADVERFFKLYTPLPLAEIAAIIAGDVNEAKKALATAVTTMVHGREAAVQAAETAKATFEQGALDLALPTVEVPRGDLATGLGIQSALVLAGLAGSNGEARRSIQAGAARLNDQLVSDERMVLNETNLLPEGVLKLAVGRKKMVLLRPV